MAKVQIDLSEKADKNTRMYMAENNISDKRIAINKILEDMKNE
jgi:hypothetical protein